MIDYFELTEIVENETQQPEFIRVNVDELTEEQRNTKLAEIESLVTCKNYRISLHRCGHLEGKPCTATLLKEVKAEINERLD